LFFPDEPRTSSPCWSFHPKYSDYRWLGADFRRGKFFPPFPPPPCRSSASLGFYSCEAGVVSGLRTRKAPPPFWLGEWFRAAAPPHRKNGPNLFSQAPFPKRCGWAYIHPPFLEGDRIHCFLHCFIDTLEAPLPRIRVEFFLRASPSPLVGADPHFPFCFRS